MRIKRIKNDKAIGALFSLKFYKQRRLVLKKVFVKISDLAGFLKALCLSRFCFSKNKSFVLSIL